MDRVHSLHGKELPSSHGAFHPPKLHLCAERPGKGGSSRYCCWGLRPVADSQACRERTEEMPFPEGDKARQTDRQNIKWDLAKLPGLWSPAVIITTTKLLFFFFRSAVTNSNTCQLKQEGLWGLYKY